MKKEHIIAIDGPAGAGKSTIARMLAARLGYIFIDTGAMYRALTFMALDGGIDVKNEEAVTALARSVSIELRHGTGGEEELLVFADGRDVTRKIRSEEVSRNVNQVASYEEVRGLMRQKQRLLGKQGGVVMEGRDIGTVVFPDADFKFYLDASIEERARRRYREMKAKGENIALEAIEESIRLRDEKDTGRSASPLRRAQDAIVVDSTSMSLREVVDYLLRTVTGRRQ